MYKHLHHIGVVYKDISQYVKDIKEMYNIKFNVDEAIIPINTLSINLEKLGHEFQVSPVGVDSENALIKRNY